MLEILKIYLEHVRRLLVTLVVVGIYEFKNRASVFKKNSPISDDSPVYFVLYAPM